MPGIMLDIADHAVRVVSENLDRLPIDFAAGKPAVRAEGHRTRFFRSPSRASVRVIVESGSAYVRLWVKQTRDAPGAFELMCEVRSRLRESGSAGAVPEPLCFSAVDNLLVMREFRGKPLTLRTLPPVSILSRGGIPGSLERLYRNIGSWLATYHSAMAVGGEASFDALLEKLRRALEGDNHFDAAEKRRLGERLAAVDRSLGRERSLTLTQPHNDFCLRNILVGRGDAFAVVDWDAALHPEFESRAPVWNDITAFVLNIRSLSRFAPFVSSAALSRLAGSFMRGYFPDKPIDAHKIGLHLWFFSLCYYVGLIGDRPLYRIYAGRHSERFARRLRKNLLLGPDATETQFDNCGTDG